MLILTDQAIAQAMDVLPVEAWRFPKIIILRPGLDLRRSIIDNLCRDFVVIEHLEFPPDRASWLLADALHFARHHLENDNQPFLFLDQPLARTDASTLNPISTHKRSCEARFAHGGRLLQLRFDVEVPVYELLPSLFSLFDQQQPDDLKFVELLKSAYFNGVK